ncbi:MAG: SOS response-associated peptidase family protein [Acetobacteraceae bacterium]
MCGRFASDLPPEALAALFRTVNPLPNVAPIWNLAPTRDAMVVRRHPENGQRHLDLLNWGLLPYWTKDQKQARRPIIVQRCVDRGPSEGAAGEAAFLARQTLALESCTRCKSGSGVTGFRNAPFSVRRAATWA